MNSINYTIYILHILVKWLTLIYRISKISGTKKIYINVYWRRLELISRIEYIQKYIIVFHILYHVYAHFISELEYQFSALMCISDDFKLFFIYTLHISKKKQKLIQLRDGCAATADRRTLARSINIELHVENQFVCQLQLVIIVIICVIMLKLKSILYSFRPCLRITNIDGHATST